MDLLEFWRVARRHRTIVVVGIALTFIAMLLVLFKPSFWTLERRSPAVYQATSTLFVTQSGFPWGRSALAEYLKPSGVGNTEFAVPRFADPSRMEYLASLYAELALSDSVRRSVERSGFLRENDEDEEYSARPLLATEEDALPLIEIAGVSRSQSRAVELANTAALALRRYVTRQQTINEVSERTRVVLPVLVRAEERDAEVIKGGGLTPALMVGLFGILATFFVAFLVENVQRQRRFSDVMEDTADQAQPERTLARIAAAEDAPSAVAPFGRD
jgi:hypothetical protein